MFDLYLLYVIIEYAKEDRTLKEKVGIIAFSWGFGGRVDPCNERLARAAQRAVWLLSEHGYVSIVVAQIEVSQYLSDVEHVVRQSINTGAYLGTEEVAYQAADVFVRRGVQRVIVIANPFLHLRKCMRLMRAMDFEVIPFTVGRIGFNSYDRQWFPRGPLRTIAYAIAQKFFGLHGA